MISPVDECCQPVKSIYLVMIIASHTFEPKNFVGGHVLLDLVNTVTARNAEPIDWLDGYPRLLEWAALTGKFDRSVLRTLEKRCVAEPHAAALALRETKEIRELLLHVVQALIKDKVPKERDLRRLEKYWRDAVAAARLVVSEGQVRLLLDVDVSGLKYLNHELVLRALTLLEKLPLERTRICPGLKCGWVFIDQSKGGQRRWCDMAVCGNAAKSRRYQARQRRSKLKV
jgi:predicted RNA-binding Zn ribbon-like protein